MSIRNWMLAGGLAVALWAANPSLQEAKKQIAAKKYDEAIASLEKAQKAEPKSAEVQKTFVDAYLGQGDSFMYNDALPPRMKYPQALKAYRKVLEFDKANKKAQTNIATIENIYKSMGRPVPQ
jgi:tetratricopeptide (TPR) repeat protein